MSKIKLEKINADIRKITKTNQWKNTNSTIEWFKNIKNKDKCSFIIFDIAEFYPSITKELLTESINFAKEHVQISNDDIDIIMHARKALLYNNNQPWVKRNGDPNFDVTMGSLDGAEASELVGLYLLSQLQTIIPKEDIGLYRDDGLGVIRNANGQRCEKIRKQFIEIFKKHNLKIEITISKIVDFLDVTFDLNKNIFKTYHKPNNDPYYVHTMSNHPPTILKQIPNSISQRISTNSSSENIFNNTAEYYNQLLAKSGYTDKISFVNPTEKKKRNRKRNIIWFNPPFSKNVKSKIGFEFLNLVDKHFGDKGNKLNKILNRNTIKVSYSCMPNMSRIIKCHNAKLLNKNKHESQTCNCRRKEECPLNGNCMAENVVYSAHVTIRGSNNDVTQPTSDQPNGTRVKTRTTRTTRSHSNDEITTYNSTTTTNEGGTQPDPPIPHNTPNRQYAREAVYIGAATNFKQRYRNHTKTFRHETYRKDTELSKYIWKLNDENISYKIDWKILRRTSGYNRASKLCNLCLSEKFEICKFKNKSILLNKRNELVSKCRHENKYILSNLPDP